MAFIGNQPTAVPLTSSQLVDGIITTAKLAADAVTSAKILDSTIVNADIASTTINLTQKVTGTLPYANGGTGVSTLGTANQVLAVNASATALEFQSVSSDYVLLATTDASASASVSFDGYFSSTYKNYKVIFSNIIPSSNGNEAFRLRYRRSNADITASNYRGIGNWTSLNTGGVVTNTSSNFNNTDYANISTASTTTSGYGLSGDLILYDPLNSTQYKIFIAQSFTSDPSQELVHFKPAGRLVDSQNALSGLTFYFSSGNIASGNFKLYGIK